MNLSLSIYFIGSLLLADVAVGFAPSSRTISTVTTYPTVVDTVDTNPWSRTRKHTSSYAPTSTSIVNGKSSTALQSAKILPVAYASASAALFNKALTSSTCSQKLVLVTTALLSLMNFAPCDNVKLASAKRALKANPDDANAKKWKSLVRTKIISQVLTLVYMIKASTVLGTMRAATGVLGSNFVFYLMGAAKSWHTDEGVAEEKEGTEKTMVAIGLTTAAAFVASLNPVGSILHKRAAMFYSAITFIAALEGIPTIKKLLNKDESVESIDESAVLANGKINNMINLDSPKVVDSQKLQSGEKAVYCRCWKSQTFPLCDGSHVKHNEQFGDNVGPLIVNRKKDE